MVNQITHVVTGFDGGSPDNSSSIVGVSADGRYVAVTITGTNDNVLENDTNGENDVIIVDLVTNERVLASRAADGSQLDRDSVGFDISADGRYVLFRSNSTDLPNNPDGIQALYRFDAQTGAVELVSVDGDGNAALGTDGEFSDDGNIIVFRSSDDDLETNGSSNALIRNMSAGTTVLASRDTGGDPATADQQSRLAINGDGDLVAFASYSTDLVADDVNGSSRDIFLFNANNNTVTAPHGTEGDAQFFSGFTPALSADGRFLVFDSVATNLIAGDTNDTTDVFLLDLTNNNQISRISVASDGSQGNGASSQADISGDGRFVVFQSGATNFSDTDTNDRTDIFVHDRDTGETRKVSIAFDGSEALRGGSRPKISDDGTTIIFESTSSNLVATAGSATTSVYAAPNPFLFTPVPPVAGTDGDDNLDAGANAEAMDGGDGFDIVSYLASAAGVTVDLRDGSGSGGDAEGDVLTNMEGLIGSLLDDLLIGSTVGNSLEGSDGDDLIYGLTGADTVDGGAGDDRLFGNGDADSIAGGDGNDSMKGQGGDDTIDGGAGNDTAFAGAVNDVINGGDGDDVLNGNSGFDTIDGGAGNDTLRGQGGRDSLIGGDGDDFLVGIQGFDTLNGGGGNDTLIGGQANDTLTGGPGADTFVFGDDHGDNVVTDFANGTDKLSVAVASLADLTITNGTGGAVVTWGDGSTSFTLTGITANQLDASDFLF
ncbi:MAG: hypothetical protein RIM84_27205 [Alphaproteobacteria bacterium]